MSRKLLLIGALVLAASPAAHATTEICGNGIDDDGNGLTDEGCYPTLTTGVCESPLSCGDTGMVSWSTGSLHYDLPPDIAPKVPYGPGIGFRRFYLSMATPGANPTSVNQTPLGPHWGHTYLTFVHLFTVGSTKYLTLHTSQGRDVLYKWDHYDNTKKVDVYLPQSGDHVLSMTVDSGNQATLQLLTGETIKYNASGQLVEIDDSLPSPYTNKVLVTWDSTTNGNVSTVTDAAALHRLSFSYTNGRMTSIQYQTFASSIWTTQHTTTFDYSSSVSHDATSGKYVPASAAEWSQLLAGTGMSGPSNLWLMQEASGNLADSIGSAPLTPDAGPSYNNTVSGWSRKAVGTIDGGGNQGFDNGSYGNLYTTSYLLLTYVALTANPGALREIFGVGGNGDHRYAAVQSSTKYAAIENDGGSINGSIAASTSVHLVLLMVNRATSAFKVYDDLGETLNPAWTAMVNGGSLLTFGSAVGFSAPARYLYAAAFSGSGAELSDTQVSTLMSRLQNGTGILHSVTIGGQLAQTYSYDTGANLTQIADGGGNQIVSFAYSSTTNGQVDLVSTTRGTVGFEYGSARSGCTGETALYFNKGNTSSCSVDGDCGSGYMCGGKTGSGATGECFLAARCLTTSTAGGESVVTNVAPIGPGGGTCTGACTDVMQYSWATATGLLNVIGTEDPLTNFTAATYNSNGLPTQVWFGATDNTGTSANRTTFITYDTLYPGRIAKTIRQSDLNATTCTSAGGTGCVVTTYSYSGTGSDTKANNQLGSIGQTGYAFTKNNRVQFPVCSSVTGAISITCAA